jgi:hypothetical protein
MKPTSRYSFASCATARVWSRQRRKGQPSRARRRSAAASASCRSVAWIPRPMWRPILSARSSGLRGSSSISRLSCATRAFSWAISTSRGSTRGLGGGESLRWPVLPSDTRSRSAAARPHQHASGGNSSGRAAAVSWGQEGRGREAGRWHTGAGVVVHRLAAPVLCATWARRHAAAAAAILVAAAPLRSLGG